MNNIDITKEELSSRNCELLGSFLVEKFGPDVIARFRGHSSTIVFAFVSVIKSMGMIND
jgi:hypothetical protein